MVKKRFELHIIDDLDKVMVSDILHNIFDMDQITFMTKTLGKLEIKAKYLNMIRAA